MVAKLKLKGIGPFQEVYDHQRPRRPFKILLWHALNVALLSYSRLYPNPLSPLSDLYKWLSRSFLRLGAGAKRGFMISLYHLYFVLYVLYLEKILFPCVGHLSFECVGLTFYRLCLYSVIILSQHETYNVYTGKPHCNNHSKGFLSRT